jgi:hypothetical protein
MSSLSLSLSVSLYSLCSSLSLLSDRQTGIGSVGRKEGRKEGRRVWCGWLVLEEGGTHPWLKEKELPTRW